MLLTKKNTLKLADLGLAKVIESTVGRTYAGSPAYMSPEIFESLFSNKIYYPNTDVWLDRFRFYLTREVFLKFLIE